MIKPDPLHELRGPRRGFSGFQDLMPRRVQNILLVSSLYDCFILEQDGQLNELFLSEFLDLNLRHAPGLTQVSSGREALEALRGGVQFNLVIVINFHFLYQHTLTVPDPQSGFRIAASNVQ